ncbi:hypothetical protein HLK59_47020, partial [Streptomyces sp. S3(2020)]|nr:hypothetical protein [Streptomyces sp. S3(2020)]
MTACAPLSPARMRRVAVAASALSVLAVAATVLALVVGASLPEPWWPRTGAAFAAEPSATPYP